MKLNVPNRVLIGLGEKYPDLLDTFSPWRKESDLTTLDTKDYDTEVINDIFDFIEADKTPLDSYSPLKKRIIAYKKLLEEGASKPIRRLMDIPDAFLAFVNEYMPNKLIYVADEFGIANPFVAMKCEYHERQEYSPAHVSFSFRAIKQGSAVSQSFSIYLEDTRNGGMTIGEILSNNDCLVETRELNSTHQEYLEKYEKLINQMGQVYVGTKVGKRVTDRYSNSSFYFKEQVSPKVVIDFEGLNESDARQKVQIDDVVEFSSIAGARIKLPIHTYGNVFHLEEHAWISIHVDYLKEYEWKGKDLMDKLVLSQTDKDLIRILIEMSKMKIEDIVEGKTGGAFIMATGEPGTGKTLTSEVFSEVIQKPLYKVQCSQLGLNVDQVEKNLKQVLMRASRWGAILLIDEADVYVRARGTDIQQNAIVGTFLRTLEYYTGILIMTSNMGTAIDDAIMSRATAHLEYSAPNLEARKSIWKILSNQFDIELSNSDITFLANHFKTAVGRDIKALLKLAKMYAEGTKQSCTIEIIQSISGFVPNVNKQLG